LTVSGTEIANFAPAALRLLRTAHRRGVLEHVRFEHGQQIWWHNFRSNTSDLRRAQSIQLQSKFAVDAKATQHTESGCPPVVRRSLRSFGSIILVDRTEHTRYLSEVTDAIIDYFQTVTHPLSGERKYVRMLSDIVQESLPPGGDITREDTYAMIEILPLLGMSYPPVLTMHHRVAGNLMAAPSCALFRSGHCEIRLRLGSLMPTKPYSLQLTELQDHPSWLDSSSTVAVAWRQTHRKLEDR
jgi:hypothetical protein